MKTYFALTDEQITDLGLNPAEAWVGILGQDDEAGTRCTFVTASEAAFECMVNVADSGIAPPEEFGEWLLTTLIEVDGWPEDW